MKIYKLLSSIVALALLFAAIPPAGVGAQTEEPQTIVAIASANANFKTLVAAVGAAGLVDTLNGDGPFTVFAPTDAAFAKLGKATIDGLLADPETLKSILLYHVVPAKQMAADVLASSSAMTAAGLPVVYTVKNNQAFINNARITATDIIASNGVIHVIDTVILPPGSDIVDTAATNPQFKTLVAAVQAAGLVDTLKSAGPFTIFAPTDAAFAKLGKATIDALLADPEALKSILLYHALPSAAYSGDVLKTNKTATVNGAEVLFSVRNGQAFINNARITATDILTTNGVIHVIDTVILPPSLDIVDTAAANPQFKTLVAAVQAAGLVDTLKGAGPFTILAPTDAAFAKLGKATIDGLLADPETLKSILLYHTLGSKAYSFDVTKLNSTKTVNGAEVLISVRNGQVFINNARVTTTDIMTTNGVIHVLDTVLLPPTKDIVDTAAANPQFKTLVAAVQAAGLVDTLKGPGPFTILAPTDAAFAKLGKATIDSLLADPEALKSILLYHALGSKAYSFDVTRLASAKTINGADIVISVRNGQVFINNARVTTTDIMTTNGVIHVLDTVLLPPTMDIVDTAAANPQFKTLVAAVQAAGLVDALKGPGPYTVFAPTDAAFAKLGKATIDGLLADPDALSAVLTYHVLPRKVYGSQAASSVWAPTVNGKDVVFSVRNGQVFINNARVTTTDILTTNGVIHVIDTVLLPPSLDIVDTAAANPQFKTLVAAVQAAGLVDTLKGKGPFTIFAPTDAAFAKLGKETIDALLADPETLKSILLYHAVSGNVYAGRITDEQSTATVNGASVQFSIRNGQVFINDARVTVTNILTTNGVIHVIDTVILPPAE